jgi:nucleoside 2-deoxyribosyltransferase
MLTVIKRAERLLTYLAEEAYELGWTIDFTDRTRAEVIQSGRDPQYVEHTKSQHSNLRAYAWSESDDWDAVKALMDHLERQGYVTAVHERTPQGNYKYAVTVEGHHKVESIVGSTVSKQAFVAMWFDPSMDEIYEKGIAPAIEGSGYDAKVINRDPTVDKIDDAIIAEIRRSKFIVADFTQGADGARGGVYFEAGFAMGLGIPVIFACHHDMTKSLHFDTRQYNHIVWSDAEDFKLQLQQRIEARIT